MRCNDIDKLLLTLSYIVNLSRSTFYTYKPHLSRRRMAAHVSGCCCHSALARVFKHRIGQIMDTNDTNDTNDRADNDTTVMVVNYYEAAITYYIQCGLMILHQRSKPLDNPCCFCYE